MNQSTTQPPAPPYTETSSIRPGESLILSLVVSLSVIFLILCIAATLKYLFDLCDHIGYRSVSHTAMQEPVELELTDDSKYNRIADEVVNKEKETETLSNAL